MLMIDLGHEKKSHGVISVTRVTKAPLIRILLPCLGNAYEHVIGPLVPTYRVRRWLSSDEARQENSTSRPVLAARKPTWRA